MDRLLILVEKTIVKVDIDVYEIVIVSIKLKNNYKNINYNKIIKFLYNNL